MGIIVSISQMEKLRLREYVGEIEFHSCAAPAGFPMSSKTIANQNSTSLNPQFTEVFSGLDSQKGKRNHEGKESWVGRN